MSQQGGCEGTLQIPSDNHVVLFKEVGKSTVSDHVNAECNAPETPNPFQTWDAPHTCNDRAGFVR